MQTIYDIVKAHGGELKVETKESEGQHLSFNYQFEKIVV
jgi:K+-sensing histidine kinase KdpD